MIRGSRVGCHRVFLTVPAVAVWSVALNQATAQTRTNLASSLTGAGTAAAWVAGERGLKYGLDLSALPIALVCLIAAKIDAGSGCIRDLIRANTSGVDLIHAVSYLPRPFCRLTARPEIERLEDLRGQAIAFCDSGACCPISQRKANEMQL